LRINSSNWYFINGFERESLHPAYNDFSLSVISACAVTAIIGMV
jgi:hypothetical protein